MKIYCMRCEAENEEEAVVCGACGNPLSGGTKARPATPGRLFDEGTKGKWRMDWRSRRTIGVQIGILRVAGLLCDVAAVFVVVNLVMQFALNWREIGIALGLLLVGAIIGAVAGVWDALERIDRSLERRRGE